MKIISLPVLSTALLMLLTFSTSVYAADENLETAANVGIQYKTHIQDKGWESNWIGDGNLSGTVGEGKRLEGLKVQLYGAIPANANIQTYVHVQNKGDLGPFTMGSLAGTEAQGLRLESIRLVLNNMPGYILKYNVQVQNKGWLRDEDDSSTWFSSGSTAGTAGEGLRLEGIRIELVEINEELEAYYATLNAVSEYDYTVDSWTDYQDIIDENVVDESNTKAEIIAATKIIIAAQANLVKGKVMSGYVNALKAVNEADYTPETWEAYQLVVIDNVVTQDSSQSEINRATLNILAAQKLLQHKVNLTEYYQALAAVREADYTSSSWAVYQSVLAGNAMTEANTQVEVDTAVQKIKLAQYKMVREFDFTAYDALLAAVKEEDYIESSWAVYQEVVDANVVDENDTQTDVEAAIKKIEAAQKQLIKKADLKYYQAALDAVSKEDYMTTSWNAYLKEISSINVNPTSKQEVVDAATQKIIEAQRSLVPAGNMVYYEELLAAVNESDYTAATWTIYQKVVDSSVVVATDGQQAINDAMLKIEAAQKKLVKGAQDFSTYNALISLNPDLYTSVTWTAYQKVIDTNYVVPADGQAKVNTAVAKLTEAKRKLVERAKDFTQYEKALKYNLYLGRDPDDKTSTKAIMEMKEIEYTTSSWATYQKVLNTNAMDADKSQAQVNTAVANIKKAQFSLLKGGSLSRYNTVLKYNIELGKDPDDSTDTKALKEMKETDYTSTTWTVYSKVLSSNEMDRDKSQAQIDAAVVKIERAQQKLALKGDITKYKEILATNKSKTPNIPMKETDYTVASWTAYEKLLASKGYLVTSDNSQAEIDRAVELIEAAQQKLKDKGDTNAYDDLVALFDGREDEFRSTPWKAYMLVRGAAINNVNSESTKTQIDDAIRRIKAAQDILDVNANRATDLDDYYLYKNELQGNESDYSPESWKAYYAEISAPKWVRTKDNTAAEVLAATQAFIDAKKLLKPSTDLTLFTTAYDLYQKDLKETDPTKKISTLATPGSWGLYAAEVEKYASFDEAGNWAPTGTDVTAMTPQSEVTLIVDAINKIRVQMSPSPLAESKFDYATTYGAYKTARDKLGSGSAAGYTESSYKRYVDVCNAYTIQEPVFMYALGKGQITDYTGIIDEAKTDLDPVPTPAQVAEFSAEVGYYINLKNDSGKYTIDSWNPYNLAYKKWNLDKVLSPTGNSEAEYIQAIKDMKDARLALNGVITGNLNYWNGVTTADVSGPSTVAIGADSTIGVTKVADKTVRIALADGAAISVLITAAEKGGVTDGTVDYSSVNAMLIPLYLKSLPTGASAYYAGLAGTDANYSAYMTAAVNTSGTKSNMNSSRDFTSAVDTTGKQYPFAYLYVDSNNKIWLVDAAKHSIAGADMTLNMNRVSVNAKNAAGGGEPVGKYVMSGALASGNVTITMEVK